ncbi:hypothetical protein Tco_0501797 [Tanacetum coccineum]
MLAWGGVLSHWPSVGPRRGPALAGRTGCAGFHTIANYEQCTSILSIRHVFVDTSLGSLSSSSEEEARTRAHAGIALKINWARKSGGGAHVQRDIESGILSFSSSSHIRAQTSIGAGFYMYLVGMSVVFVIRCRREYQKCQALIHVKKEGEGVAGVVRWWGWGVGESLYGRIVEVVSRYGIRSSAGAIVQHLF